MIENHLSVEHVISGLFGLELEAHYGERLARDQAYVRERSESFAAIA